MSFGSPLGNPLGNPLGQARAAARSTAGVGGIEYFSSDPGPDWLFADGRVLQQSEYPELFAKLGLLDPIIGPVTDVSPATAKASMTDFDYRGETVLVAYSAGIARSGNSGLSWTLIPLTGVTKVTQGIDGVWVAAGASNCYRSTDDGVTWSALPNLALGNTPNDLKGDGAGVILFTHYAGSPSYLNYCSVSLDNGATWNTYQLPNTTDTNSRLYTLTSLGNGVWLGVTKNQNNIVRSTDNGVTWSVRATSSETYFSSIKVGHAVTYLPYGVSSSRQTRTSYDGGVTWSAAPFDKAFPAIYGVASDGYFRSAEVGGLGEMAFIFKPASGTYSYVGWTSTYRQCTNTMLVVGRDGIKIKTNYAGKWLAFCSASSGYSLSAFSATYGYDATTQFKLPDLMSGPLSTTHAGKLAYIKAR